MICYECKKIIYRKNWKYCSYCGKLLHMCTKPSYITTMADGAQLNRIEIQLDKINKDILKCLKK